MTRYTLALRTGAALLATLLTCPATAQTGAGQPPELLLNTKNRAPALAQTSAIPDPLTVEEAVRIGVARNPQIIAGAAGVASALANYRSLAAFPGVQLGITHAQGTSTAPTLNGAEADTFFDVGEVLDTSGQRRYQAAGARAQYGAARYQQGETQITLEQQIRDAYWSLVAAEALLKYSMESLQEAQRVNDLVRTQQAAGAVAKVDVVRSSIDVANTRQAYITAQGAERSALSALNLLLVRPPYAPVRAAEEMATGVNSKESLPRLPDLPALTASALANRPLVKSAIELVHVADYAVKQARATRRPDLAIDFERSLQQTSDTVLLSVRFPILDFGSIHYSVRAAEETRKQAVAQKEQAEQQVIQQVAQAFQDVTQAQVLLASYQTEILEPSMALRDMVELGYKQGATGILPLIDAESTLRTARTGYINSLLAVHKAQDEILAATGGPAPH